MKITKIIQDSQGDYRVNIKSDRGRMVGMFLSRSSANLLIGDAGGQFAIYKDGSDTVHDFESYRQEPQLWYDEDMTPSEEEPEPKPLPNTFTWEEMDDAFQAGANYGAAEPGTRPDFGAFMDGLGLSRSKS